MSTVDAGIPAIPGPSSARGWNAFLASPMTRLAMLLVLWLLLQIPLAMIEGLVQERQARRDEAGTEVMSKWGGSQQVIGPVLRVPYIEHSIDSEGKPRQERRAAYLLPENLQVDADLKTEERRRGIFSFPVYGASLKLSGRFQRPPLAGWIGTGNEPMWDQAELQLGLSDVRAIHADGHLTWAGQKHALHPSPGTGAPGSGVHVPLRPAYSGADPFGSQGQVDFALDLRFNGSRELYFAPVGRDTNATVHANWADPSFQGAWLPTSSQVGQDAFRASWSISYLGRDYPQQWTSTGYLVAETFKAQLFGVSLLTPIDAYRMAERVTKYAVLAAFFTFLTLWLTEILGKRRVHPVQYLLVGAALSLFGLLQLAVGEHFGFETGFVAATMAITGMVTVYSKSVLGSWRRSLTVGALLGGLYGYLYLLLQADDYALLGGAIALFIGLGVVMVLTRNVDWHRLGGGG